jgi:hypothetical protein
LNDGSRQFLNKWGITSASFTRFYLRRGQDFQNDNAVNIRHKALRMALLKSYLKRILWLIGGTGKTRGRYSYNKVQMNGES